MTDDSKKPIVEQVTPPKIPETCEKKPQRPIINITDEEWFDPTNKGCCA